jgi:DNA end-binding protein Ku
MRFADQIRPADGLDIPGEVKVDRRELDLALQLVDTLAGDWTPGRYHDTYRETLKSIIEQKIAGKEIAVPKAARPAKVVDLMDALRKSLETPRRRAGETAKPTRARRPRAASRRRAA